MGFENEKDHPEVAPSQFEMNYTLHRGPDRRRPDPALQAALPPGGPAMDMTASFLPKPVTGVNGSGMHTNMTLAKNGKNLFYDDNGRGQPVGPAAGTSLDRILHSAEDLCLMLNSSVNAYRRLDPNYEAPNEITASAIDRSSMIRIPLRGQGRPAHRGPLDRAGRQPVHADLHPAAHRPGRTRSPTQRARSPSASASACCRATSTTPWPATGAAPGSRRCWARIRHAKYHDLKEASAHRCPRETGRPHQARGDHVPPRGDQPDALEPVLGIRSSSRRNDGAGPSGEPAPFSWTASAVLSPRSPCIRWSNASRMPVLQGLHVLGRPLVFVLADERGLVHPVVEAAHRQEVGLAVLVDLHGVGLAGLSPAGTPCRRSRSRRT